MHFNFELRYIYFGSRYNLGQKYHAPHVHPDQGLNSWRPDHDSTVHVTETPALTISVFMQKYHAPQVQSDRVLNSWPPDHDSTVYVSKAWEREKGNIS